MTDAVAKRTMLPRTGADERRASVVVRKQEHDATARPSQARAGRTSDPAGVSGGQPAADAHAGAANTTAARTSSPRRRGNIGRAAAAVAPTAARPAGPPRPARPAGPPRPAGAATEGKTDIASLREQARATRAGRTWDPDALLSQARNAHHSNTPTQMRDALAADFNWLEGDLRADKDGNPVMAHDADAERSGLTLDQWLKIGAKSQRGMKVDVKEPAAIAKMLDALEASGIPDGRLMINVGDIPVEDVREIRTRFPDAWIALTPETNDAGSYDRESLRRTIENADAAGGRVAFPLRWDIADDAAIAALKQHGAISIWTDKGQGTPDDSAAETARLRERGVDGVIDLGPPSSVLEKGFQRLTDIWESDPARGARDLGRDALDVARSGVDLARVGAEAVVDIAGGGIDLAREGASRLPIVGGLFD